MPVVRKRVLPRANFHWHRLTVQLLHCSAGAAGVCTTTTQALVLAFPPLSTAVLPLGASGWWFHRFDR